MEMKKELLFVFLLFIIFIYGCAQQKVEEIPQVVEPEVTEDVPEEIVEELVKELSKNHTKYEDISSREGLLIKMADDLHNVSTIPEGDTTLLKKKQMKIKITFFKETT